MNTNVHRFTSHLADGVLHGGLIVAALAVFPGPALAQEPEPQTTPISVVDLGLGPVSQDSYKAGEYNGLEKAGAFLIGNLDLRSHAAYDSTSALRWRVKGTDLGLESRGLTAQIGVQGKYRVRFGFDQLRRNRSDTYQTPYDGAGSNVLTLPAGWLVPSVAASGGANSASARGLVPAVGNASYISTAAANNGALISASPSQTALVNAAAAADLPAFHNVNLQTTRTRYDAGFNYMPDPRWTIDVNFRPEHKDGLKPMGTVSRNTGGDISTVIPDRIDTQTNQISANLAFKGKKTFVQAGYYGSFFTNQVPSMSWQNWAAAPGVVNANTISSTPDNSFNQYSATGGVNLSSSTKLVASGSYARNTQNVAFIRDASTAVVPVGSLNGLMVFTSFNAKLTSRPAKKLNTTIGYRYEDRDNRTPVNIFQYADANEPLPAASTLFPAGSNNPLGALIAQNANANRPYSRRMNQFDAEADFAVATRQHLKANYGFEKLDYSCPGSWISCVDAATTNEHTLRAEWRGDLHESLTARISYAYSQRRTPNYNENAFLALVPYANVSPTTATDGATALSFMTANGWTGYGPTAGYAATTGNMNVFFPLNNALPNAIYANNNRISELPGMRRYYVSDRNRGKVRTLLTWEATDQLTFQAGVDVNRDLYPGATYGVQNSKSWALDLDGTYALGENASVNLFYTYDDGRSLMAGNSYTANSNATITASNQPGAVGLSGNGCDTYTTLLQRNNNNKIDPCLNWSADRFEKAQTVGIGLGAKSGRLDLSGNLTAMRAHWDNNVSGGSWANNLLNGPGAAPTTIAAFFIAATPLPTVTADTVELRLHGKLTLGSVSAGKGQALHLAYAYLHMQNTDWMYDGMQLGSLSAQLPTNEKPFSYTVNVVGLSYVLSF